MSFLQKIFDRTILEKIAVWNMYVVLALVPLAFYPESLYIFLSIKFFILMVAGVIASVVLILFFLKYRIRIPHAARWIIGASLIFMSLAWTSSLFGTNFIESLFSSFNRMTGLATATAAYAVAMAVYVTSHDRLRVLYNMLGITAIVGILVGIPMFFAKDGLQVLSEEANTAWMGGFTGNSTFAGLFVTVSLFSAACLSFVSRGRRRMWWIVVTVLLLLSPTLVNLADLFQGELQSVLDLIGTSRAAVVSIVVASVIVGLYWMSLQKKRVSKVLGSIGLVVVFMGLFFVGVRFYNEGSRIHQGFADVASSTRFLYAEITLQGVRERPIFGHGFERFGPTMDRYFDTRSFSSEYLEEVWADKPHNIVLELAHNVGFVGLCAYLFLLFVMIREGARLMRDYAEYKIAPFLLVSIFAVFLQKLFAFDTLLSWIDFFWVMVGMIILSEVTRQERIRYDEHNFLKMDGQRLVAVVVVGCAALLGLFYFAVQPFRETNALPRAYNTPSADRFEAWQHAMALSPVGAERDEGYSLHQLNSLYAALINDLIDSPPQHQQIFIQELIDMTTYYEQRYEAGLSTTLRETWALANTYNLLFLYANSWNIEIPVNTLDRAYFHGVRALRMSRGNLYPYWVLANTLLMRGQLQEGVKMAQLGATLNPEIITGYNYLYEIVMSAAGGQNAEQNLAQVTAFARQYIPDYEYTPRVPVFLQD